MNKSDVYKFNSISKDSVINGDVEFSCPTNIFGKVVGNIKVNSDDSMTIFSDSTIQGDIQCHDIEIQGVVEGNVYSRGTITIKSSAIVSGTLQSKKLVVYPGSELNLEAHCE